MSPKEPNIFSEAQSLKKWFRKGARDLPWRQKPVDPYQVWISEIMSQQSTLKTVVPYFEKWMKLFPDLESLAKASEEKVLKAWAGLGYYSRARNIHKSAQELLARRHSTGEDWPETQDDWLKLKGVGPYTAAAVAAMAFGQKLIPVDGNVLRVGARYWGVPDPLNSSVDKDLIIKKISTVAQQMSRADVWLMAQAWMELGALVCRPSSQALCELCPLAPSCRAHLESRVAEWPKPKKRAPIKEIILLADIYSPPVLRQIPSGERLEGQWELPMREASLSEIKSLSRKTELIGPVTHHITKYRFRAYAQLKSRAPRLSKGQKRMLDFGAQADQKHLTTLTLKLLRKSPHF